MRDPKLAPTVDEVRRIEYWWSVPPDDGKPHILAFDLDGMDSDTIMVAAPGCIPCPFIPAEWPGEWVPIVSPDKQGEVVASVEGVVQFIGSDADIRLDRLRADWPGAHVGQRVRIEIRRALVGKEE